MVLDDWKSYLPIYHFSPYLRTCFGCLALLIVGACLLLFLVLPSIFSTINSWDEAPIVDILVGSFLDLGVYRLEVLAVENDTPCPGEERCSPPDSVTVRFRDTLYDSEYSINYMETSPFSDVVSLPRGYVVRIVNLSPDSASVSDAYTVRFQIFQPPKK